MLYVKTKVRPSSIEGLGLFADENIPKGTIIAQFNTRFCWIYPINSTSRVLPQIAQDFLEKYGWKIGDKWIMDVDDSRFINHSYTPNIVVTTENLFTSRAARGILKGEELTEDYREFDRDFDKYGSKW